MALAAASNFVTSSSLRLFGKGAGKEISKNHDIDFLGSIEMRRSYSDPQKIAYLEDMEANDEYNRVANNLIQKLD